MQYFLELHIISYKIYSLSKKVSITFLYEAQFFPWFFLLEYSSHKNLNIFITKMSWMISFKLSIPVVTRAACSGTHSSLSSHCNLLTHLPLDKMATILADDIFKCIFSNENVRNSIQISLKFVPKFDNKPALVQVMAWRWTGDKPLPEAILTQFIDAYLRH